MVERGIIWIRLPRDFNLTDYDRLRVLAVSDKKGTVTDDHFFYNVECFVVSYDVKVSRLIRQNLLLRATAPRKCMSIEADRCATLPLR